MNTLSKFLKERQGGANAILGIVILLGSMFMIMLLLEIGRLYIIVEKIQNDLDASNAATWAVVDRERLAYKQIQFNTVSESRATGDHRAKQKFIEFLKKNMDLNANLRPNDPDKYMAGPVTIERFEVYLKSDLPLTNSDGIYINKVSVYSKINVPIELMFSMFGDVYQAKVKRVTNLEDDL